MPDVTIKITVQSRSAWWWTPCQWLLIATLRPAEATRLISHRQALGALNWIFGRAVQFRVGGGPWMKAYIPKSREADA